MRTLKRLLLLLTAQAVALTGCCTKSVDWPWAVVLCKFNDVPTETRPPDFYSDFYTKTGTGGACDYWRQVSFDQLDLTHSQVFGWFTMNHTRADVANLHFPGDRWQLFQWGIDAARANKVDLSRFKSILVVQNYGPDHGAAGNGVVVVHSDPNLIEHGFISHEMGHAFGLPHSWSANPDTVYGDGWDIMSWDTGTSPTSDFRVAFEGAQGTAGPGLNLRNIQALGLLPKGGKWTPATTNFSETIYLHPLNQHHVCLRYVAAQIPPTATNPVRPSNSTFTVEYRHKAGPDAGIPQDAVLIHEIRGNGLSYLQPTWGSQLLVGQQFITPSPQVFIKVLVIDTNAQVAKVQISSPATVPNLLRKSWSLARATARAAGFGTVTTGSKPGAVTQPIVDTQSPAAGSTAAYGSDISVTLIVPPRDRS